MKKKLEKACSKGDLVRLWREDIEHGSALGYIEGVGDEWFTLCFVGPDINFDGFSCMRSVDVTEFDASHDHTDFVERALEIRGSARPVSPKIDLTSIRTILESAGQQFTLVTLHREEVDPETCWIGSVLSVDDEVVRLRAISPDAKWLDEPEVHELAEITRVDVGARYEEALELVSRESS